MGGEEGGVLFQGVDAGVEVDVARVGAGGAGGGEVGIEFVAAAADEEEGDADAGELGGEVVVEDGVEGFLPAIGAEGIEGFLLDDVERGVGVEGVHVVPGLEEVGAIGAENERGFDAGSPIGAGGGVEGRGGRRG